MICVHLWWVPYWLAVWFYTYRKGSEAEEKLLTYPQSLDKEETEVRFEPGQAGLTLRLVFS